MSESEQNRSGSDPSEVAAEWIQRAEQPCRVHDHITQVLSKLDLPEEGFHDQYKGYNPERFDFDAIVRVLLYREVCEFSYRKVEKRFSVWPHLLTRFGLDRAPSEQVLSHTFRNRLSLHERHVLGLAGEGIRRIAAEEGLLSAPDEGPPIQPEEKGERGLTEREVNRAVRIARDRVFPAFVTNRAPNAKYEDAVYWELQAYLSMVKHGKSGTKRRVNRFSRRSEMPHGDTHTRVIKKLGAPDPQTELSEFHEVAGGVNWKRVRKTLLEPFQKAIENLIEETDFEDYLREPVNVAIDVTPWEFNPSPWLDKDRGIPKADYPTMVSGYKNNSADSPSEKYKRGYKFATLTVVGKNTPIVLAMTPVRESSKWEPDCVEGMKKAEIVDELLAQAQQYVDINKVMADREFDAHAVRDVIDRRGLNYLIPKRVSSQQDLDDIDELKRHDVVDIAVTNDITVTVNGRTHGVDFIYFPSSEESGRYAIITTNMDVPLERAQGLKSQYRERWMIEIEYKTIKQHFLPPTTSTDYRVRLFYFVAGVLMYNIWRLTNLLLRKMFDVHLGDSPPVPAGEVSEALLLLGPGYG